jgi:hypothetical protein
LDDVFSRAAIAVLLTYDSDVLKKHTKSDAAFTHAFESEIRAHHKSLASKALPKELTIHLILIPLSTKAKLLKALDQKLKALQQV